MKKIIWITLSILISTLTFAQKSIKVKQVNENIGGGSHDALSVIIYDVDAKHVEKYFQKEMKHMHAKVGHQHGELFGDNARHKKMGDNTFDIWAKSKKVSDGETELIVAVDLGGAFMNSGTHGAQFKVMREIVLAFAKRVTKDAIHDHLKLEEKTLKHLEKDQSHLVHDNEKFHKNIEQWNKEIEQAKKDIEQAKKDIEQNVKDQETKKSEIGVQKKIVEEVTAKEKALG